MQRFVKRASPPYSKFPAPKSLSQGTENTHQSNKMQQNGRKAGIRFMLKDHSEMDRQWLANQDKWNDEQMKSNVVIIGSWQIVAQKWIRLEFKPTTGETWIIFEQYPNKHGFFTGLRLTDHQWCEFQTYFGTILQYISMAETGGSWQNMTKSNPLHHYEGKKKNFMSGTFQEIVRFPVCEDDIYVTLTSYDATSLGGCTVDIRKCTFVNDESNKGRKHLVHLLKGLTVVGGGFHYMATYLRPRINAGIKMCEAMFIGGQAYVPQLTSEFDRCNSIHQQQQTNAFRMGNVRVLDDGNIVPVGIDQPDMNFPADDNEEEEAELIRIAREIEEREFGFCGN